MSYIGRPEQISNLNFELELILIIIKEFGVQTYKIIEKSFI